MKQLVIGATFSLVFVFFFLNQLMANIDKPINNEDNFYQYFFLQNNFTKLAKGDWGNLFETRMFYPRQNTLAYGNSLLGQALIGMPVYLLTRNVVISAHAVVLISLFLSFLLMYLLAYRLTQNIYAACVAGLIFTYNPYVFAQFFFELLTLFWIPAIFLVSETLLKRVTWTNSLILALLFFGQLISSFYYTFFLIILWPIYIAIRILTERMPIKRFIRIETLVSFLIFVVLAIFYLSPSQQVKQQYQVKRVTENLEFHSARILDFVSTVPRNRLYGGLMDEKGSIGSHKNPAHLGLYETEHSLFPGLTAIALFFICIILWKRSQLPSNLRSIVKALFFVLVVSFILSFGPYIHLADLRIPSPYLLMYKLVPFADTLRAPSRFWVMGLFAIAFFSTFAVATVTSGRRRATWFVILLILLISLEYHTRLTGPYIVPMEITKLYQWIEAQPDIKVIVELPIANDLSQNPALFRSFIAENRYLLYGLYHSKKIVNGGAGFIPPDAIALGQWLTVDFPSSKKLDYLRSLNIDAIILHRNEFQDSRQGKEMTEKLRHLDLIEAYKSDNVSVFLLQ